MLLVLKGTLDFAKCHCFPKTESKLLAYAHLVLISWLENEGGAATHSVSGCQRNQLCGNPGNTRLVCFHPIMDANRVCAMPPCWVMLSMLHFWTALQPSNKFMQNLHLKHQFNRMLNFKMISELQGQCQENTDISQGLKIKLSNHCIRNSQDQHK